MDNKVRKNSIYSLLKAFSQVVFPLITFPYISSCLLYTSSQTIMKFRYSEKQRVFGYRKGDRFRVILIERDHKISNNG